MYGEITYYKYPDQWIFASWICRLTCTHMKEQNLSGLWKTPLMSLFRVLPAISFKSNHYPDFWGCGLGFTVACFFLYKWNRAVYTPLISLPFCVVFVRLIMLLPVIVDCSLSLVCWIPSDICVPAHFSLLILMGIGGVSFLGLLVLLLSLFSVSFSDGTDAFWLGLYLRVELVGQRCSICSVLANTARQFSKDPLPS